MSDDDLESLRKQTSQGDRIDKVAAEQETQNLVEDIVAELEAIDQGEQQKAVSVWDGPLAAFIRALEENPEQLEDVGHALQQRLDRETSDVDRSEILRCALRIGFRETAPDEYEAVQEAVRQHATQRL